MTGLVTLPLTYSLLKPTGDDDSKAVPIKTDYKHSHADVVTDLRAAQKRKQRRIKRAVVALGGWALMAGMAYLIMTTTPVVNKIWNPYDILGISEVSEKSACNRKSVVCLR